MIIDATTNFRRSDTNCPSEGANRKGKQIVNAYISENGVDLPSEEGRKRVDVNSFAIFTPVEILPTTVAR